MNLNEETLKAIEELAYRLIPPGVIAINIECDELDFIERLRTPGTEIRTAFYKGYLRQLIETRESIIKSAQNGSNPAQVELLKFMHEMNNHILYE
ncbi:MAG: hypothetical protein RR397_10780 [Odoribacter sp.]